MQSQNRLFDDFVKVMNGAAGTIAGMTREAQSAMQERMREWIGGLDLVGREEFDAVRAMAVAAREESQALKLRVEALEAALADAAARPAGGRGRRKPAAPEGGEA
jgi:BMFP domain-containing protein YqiC